MCGRYVLATPVAELAEYFSAQLPPGLWESFRPSWNIPPTTNIIALTADSSGSRDLGLFRWGLVPRWAKDLSFGAKTINARVETVATKPSFRSAFHSQRCIIPADGYFEWKTTAGEVKQPYYFTSHDESPLAFAGLWERYELHTRADEATRSISTCAIITTEAGKDVETIHNRMPAILDEPDTWGRWLDGALNDREELLAMCRPAPPGTLKSRRVEILVNSVRNNGPELIEELLDRPSLF
ncbi:MAG TPA: SOS response-associated peptidase [Acidimicrobiales bacterium]|nr:SOS response-associated peptidase [Acidimicrobiales bacterium]